EPQPHERAISAEEEAILWRSMERIPEIYREPLVLFYREHQSIEAVAQNLELSEDAVKQRLSRGRKLLHEEVLAFVEGTLARTNPFHRNIGLTTGILFAVYALGAFWICPVPKDYALLSSLWLSGLIVIYFVMMFGFILFSIRKVREYYSGLLTREHAGNFPE